MSEKTYSLKELVQFVDDMSGYCVRTHDEKMKMEAVRKCLETQEVMERVSLANRNLRDEAGRKGIDVERETSTAFDTEVDHANDIGVKTGTVQVAPSGIQFRYWNPTPDMILVPDMAHHLARIPRFGGASDGSVAQHCIVGSRYLDDLMLKRCFFLHDFEEYVMGDMASPLKKLIGPLYKEIANGIRAAGFEKFGLPIEWAFQLPPEVKAVDEIMLEWERRDQMPTAPWIEKKTLGDYGPYTAWSRNEAELKYMQRFSDLWPEFEF